MSDVIERRRIAVATPRSVDRELREFEAVIATGEPIEGVVLALAGLTVPDDVTLRLDHSPTAAATVGRLIEWRREGDVLIARFRISGDRSLDWLVERIADGTLTGVSVGFRVDEWGEGAGGARVAAKATLIEVSITPTPADANARVRSTMTEAVQPAPAGDPAPAPVVVERAAVNREIRAIGQTFGLGATFADDLIDRAATADEARQAAQAAVAARSRGPVFTAVSHLETPETFVARAAEGQLARINPRHKPSDAARQYASASLVDIARTALGYRGQSTAGAAHEIITRALHTTSDFPAILGDSIGRQVRMAYQAAPDVLKRVARQTTARDFKTKTSIQLGEAPTLDKVNEKGEYTYGSLAEARETYKLATYGKIIGLSRQALVNDDLGAFADIAERMGRGAAETEANLKVALLTSGSGLGPTMADGAALFHTTHGNIAATGATIDATTLSAGRTALRKQRGLSGQPINVTPRFILVPPDLELTAERNTTATQPNAVADVNPFGGRLEVLVDARLTNATRWYVVADPTQVAGLEYAYLEGEEGPQITTRAGFDVDGVEVKVRLDFGCAFVDWRGWYTNAGA